MSEQMKNCKVCNESIAKKAKTCPHCGASNKTPLYKKWWVWVIVVVIVVVAASSSGSEPTEVSNTQTPTATQTDTSAETSTKETGEKTKVEEAYLYLAENADTPFNINEKALNFMKEHSEYFPGTEQNKGAISDFVDNEITYAHLTKNINKYGDKLINVSGDVVDIIESDDGTVTYLHLYDYEGNSYIVYYLGSLDNVFDGGYTWGYALPLDTTSFENMSGAYTEAVVCAGSYINDTIEE